MKQSPKAKWFMPNFDLNDTFKKPSTDSNLEPVKKTPKKRQPPKKASKKITDTSSVNILDKVAPKNAADLAVHAKKIQEVEEWLQYNVLRSNKLSVLLMTGPAGAGKTVTLQVLCKSLNIKIFEWVNSIDTNFDEFKGPGQTAKFVEFLTHSSRYTSVLVNNNAKTQIILVEDFPNSIVYNPSEFESILELLYSRGKYSAVFICTETKDHSNNLGQKLFPEQTKHKFGINTISFNPVSVTLLKTALKRTNSILQEQYSDIFQAPSQDTVETIVNSAMGDIRSALNYFNFASLKGSVNLPTIKPPQQSQSGTKRKRKEKDKSTLSNMSRDEPLGLLHGVGRVLYPKRMDHPSGSGWRLERNPETIVDQFISMPTIFSSFLHENYPKYFGSFSDANQAAEFLSFAELLLAEWGDDHVTTCGLWVAIMGLMIANKNAVSKWNPVSGPKHLKYKFVEEYHNRRKIDSIDVGYYNLIKPSGYVTKGPRFL